MCLIVDANVAHELSALPLGADARQVVEMLKTKKLKLVIGGELTRELFRTQARNLIRELRAPLKITCWATVCRYRLTMKAFDQNFWDYYAFAGSFFSKS